MITLRAVELADGDALHAIFTEPGVRLYLFDDELLTRAETERYVEASIAHGAWVILHGSDVIGLTSLRPTGEDRELMIVIGEHHWGSDVAFAAAQAAMRHGFEVLKLRRILAAVDLPNERSHRLMLRLGFLPMGEVDGPKYRARTYMAVSTAASRS